MLLFFPTEHCQSQTFFNRFNWPSSAGKIEMGHGVQGDFTSNRFIHELTGTTAVFKSILWFKTHCFIFVEFHYFRSSRIPKSTLTVHFQEILGKC
jgi:hypothetical protein